MTVTDMEIYESQRQSLEHLGLLGCSSICYEQLCDSFIIAVESAYEDFEAKVKLIEEFVDCYDMKSEWNDWNSQM